MYHEIPHPTCPAETKTKRVVFAYLCNSVTRPVNALVSLYSFCTANDKLIEKYRRSPVMAE